MKRKLISLLMAGTLALSLAACGGSSSAPAADSNADAAAEETQAEEAPAESAEAADETAGASGKVWKIVTDTAFKPFEYTDDNGDFVGIDMDILAAVAEDQGFTYELQILGWDASIAACQAGQADGMIAGASITEERKASGWIFSDGYYDANQSMAVEASSDITGFDGLSGKSVAVKTGTMSAAYAESLMELSVFSRKEEALGKDRKACVEKRRGQGSLCCHGQDPRRKDPFRAGRPYKKVPQIRRQQMGKDTHVPDAQP